MLELVAACIGTGIGIGYRNYPLAAVSFLFWVGLVAHRGGVF